MKRILILLLAIGCQLTVINYQSKAQGLKNVIVEKFYVSDANDAAGSAGNLPAGSVTYRIFIEMMPNYKFQAVYGLNNPLHELRIETTTSFFNNEDRGASLANDIKSIYLKNNSVMLDSWLSVGAGSGGNFGVLKAYDNNGAITNADGILQNTDASAGIPVKTEDGLMPGTPQSVTTVGIDGIIGVFGDGSANGNLFSTTNGSWASLNGSAGPLKDNRVLIAQITTDGILTFKLNVQVKNYITLEVENYVAENAQGKEMQRNFLTYSSATSNMKPIVEITSPADSATFNSSNVITITANAFDPDGTVSSVEFFVDSISTGTDNSAPFSADYNCMLGHHTIFAVATDSKGAKDTSAYVTINGIVGINELGISNEELGIKFYPNPAQDYITIELNSGNKYSNCNYSIFNLLAKKILSKKLAYTTDRYEERIDLSSFPQGVYLLQLITDNKITTKKIVKK